MSGDVTYQALKRLTWLPDRDDADNGSVIAGQNYYDVLFTGGNISNTNITGGVISNVTIGTFDINGSLQGDILYRNATGWVTLHAGSVGQVLSTNGSNANPTWITVSGSGSVTSVDVSGGTTGLTTTGGPITSTGTITIAGTLKEVNGGTNQTSYTQGDLLYASASNTLAKLAKSTSATRYLSNTGASNAPAWAQIDLTTGITGILPGANGGTGIANTGKTITLGGNLTTSGSSALTLTTVGVTNVTLPVTGTLVNTTANNIAFTGGSISGVTFDGGVIGGVTPAAGTFTTLTALTSLSASSFNATGSSAPANGLYLPSGNTPGISSAGLVVATFNSPGAGGDYLAFQNVAASGLNTIALPTAVNAALSGTGAGLLGTGNYSYKVTYLSPSGETAVGATSNVVNVTSPGTNGKMTLTGIPVSVNGTVTARKIYRTQAGGSSYFFLTTIANNTTTTFADNIADSTLKYSALTAQGQSPTYVSVATASATDTSIGMVFNTIGTTTTGLQWIGNSTQGGLPTSGGYKFNINGVTAFQILDNYFNPNTSYQGAPTAWPIVSSGALAGGPDNICIISCDSSLYPSTATGVSLMYVAKGATGQQHFTSNGVYAHFTVTPPGNPIAPDTFTLANGLAVSGSATGSGKDALIYTQYATNTNPDNLTGITFYNQGAGDFKFLSNNTNTSILQAKTTGTSDIQGFIMSSSPTGSSPTLSVGTFNGFFSPDTNLGINISTHGIGNLVFQSADSVTTLATLNGSTGYLTLGVSGAALMGNTLLNLGVGTTTQMFITSTANAVNLLSVTGGATGGAAILSVAGSSADAVASMSYQTKGDNSLHRFYCSGAIQATITGSSTATSSFQLAGNVNAAAISVQGGTAATLTIYTASAGNILFESDNTATTLFQMLRVASSVNWLYTQPATTGTPGILGAAGETNAGINILTKGNEVVKFGNASNFSVNGSVATTMTSLGPTGSHTTIQEWFTFKNASGTVRYVPCY